MAQQYYDLISENTESTVVSEYQEPYRKVKHYQREADLEADFIKKLQMQAYEYLPIHAETDLISNLRQQLEKLNDIHFTDAEWKKLFGKHIAGDNMGIKEKTALIQESPVVALVREDGSVKNIHLLDKVNIHNNRLQVINQYEEESGSHSTRYDVTILVNGLPLAHIELKRPGVDIKEAFNQINRYQRDSFWAGSGLFQYAQIFIISNGTLTKYYSNTTRESHVKEQSVKREEGKSKTSNSYEFTSWWTDAKNHPIRDLMGFTETFLAKHTLLNILTKYCVFTTDRVLLVMRPYQIAATESILTRINTSHHVKRYGTTWAGGYIWHTTGSGKTLTSFKTALLASKLPYIDKVLFVVDRKDLDYQTMKEYDKFQEGAANGNTNTAILKRQLANPECKIIITTIQKLSILVSKKSDLSALTKEVVFIFDECHRSQFGEMRAAIVKSFKKYYMFGFTGTPIFSQNANMSGKPNLSTTEQVFGEMLHKYTIVNAIKDGNVLPFRIDYVATMKEEENIKDAKVWDIDRERALASPQRISAIVKYILENFRRKTKWKFNSIFAVPSIPVAMLYYKEFQRQMQDLPETGRLKIATIYSFGMNADDLTADGLDEENSDDTSGLDQSARDFLDEAIKDYNKLFKTNFDTSGAKFQNYYKDVSQKMKKRELDMLIVVNMFLTGFDATTLNTLWVDKNLKMHGLIQAFSRTNRILNSVKTFGNVVCFRNLEQATNDALSLFGDEEAGGIVLLKTFEEYYYGYILDKKPVKGYAELVGDLLENYPLQQEIIGEENQKKFIKLFSAILKLQNILSTFDEFKGKEIFSEGEQADYRSHYIDLYRERRKQKKDSEDINDDIVFEMELIKHVEVNIDYILMLAKKYHKEHIKDGEIIVKLNKVVDSTVELRNKKDLIAQFISQLTPQSNVDDDWNVFVNEKKQQELNQIIDEERLKPEETRTFMNNAFRNGYIESSGMAFTQLLPRMSLFDKSRSTKREKVLERLTDYFDRFYDICGGKLFE